jgi:hypothetical protein
LTWGTEEEHFRERTALKKKRERARIARWQMAYSQVEQGLPAESFHSTRFGRCAPYTIRLECDPYYGLLLERRVRNGGASENDFQRMKFQTEKTPNAGEVVLEYVPGKWL